MVSEITKQPLAKAPLGAPSADGASLRYMVSEITKQPLAKAPLGAPSADGASLRYSGPLTPAIIALVSACMFHIWGRRLDDTDLQIKDTIEGYSKRFGLEKDHRDAFKAPLFDFLKKTKERIDEVQMPRVDPPAVKYPSRKEMNYDTHIDGEYHRMSRRDVLGLQSQREEFLVWAWVDDERSEIFIDHQKSRINPDTYLWKLLALILKSVGKDLLREEIQKEIGKIAIPQHMWHLKKATDHKLDQYIEAKRWRYTIKPFKACLISKKK
jgi:hypothetical protein